MVQAFIVELLSWDKKIEVGEGKSEEKCLYVCVCMCKMDGTPAFLGVWVKLHADTARGRV